MSTTIVRTRRLFDLDFVDDVDVQATVERLLRPQDGEDGEPVVFTPNVDTIVRLRELEPGGVADRLRNARCILPDGQPIVWLSRLMGRPLRSRLAGSDLVPPLWRRIVADGRRAVVVASSEDVAGALRAELPSLATYVPPRFDEGDRAALAEVVGAVAEVVDRAEPEFVFLGISYPKQQLLAFEDLEELEEAARRLAGRVEIGDVDVLSASRPLAGEEGERGVPAGDGRGRGQTVPERFADAAVVGADDVVG